MPNSPRGRFHPHGERMDYRIMAAKKKNGFINYLLIGLVAICVVLVISEMYTNTAQELQTNGSKNEFVINTDKITDYEQYTPAPDTNYGYGSPTADPFDKYGDTGE